ncbi:MAG: hypothetical protein SVK54_00500 [candidate division WOR-3 bacterium]|nr:hypothetical protein [candidate division WOR-3 bacterium]
MRRIIKEVNLGIIICDRYRNCTGGKCLRAMNYSRFPDWEKRTNLIIGNEELRQQYN